VQQERHIVLVPFLAADESWSRGLAIEVVGVLLAGFALRGQSCEAAACQVHARWHSVAYTGNVVCRERLGQGPPEEGTVLLMAGPPRDASGMQDHD